MPSFKADERAQTALDKAVIGGGVTLVGGWLVWLIITPAGPIINQYGMAVVVLATVAVFLVGLFN